MNFRTSLVVRKAWIIKDDGKTYSTYAKDFNDNEEKKPEGITLEAWKNSVHNDLWEMGYLNGSRGIELERFRHSSTNVELLLLKLKSGPWAGDNIIIERSGCKRDYGRLQDTQGRKSKRRENSI